MTKLVVPSKSLPISGIKSKPITSKNSIYHIIHKIHGGMIQDFSSKSGMFNISSESTSIENEFSKLRDTLLRGLTVVPTFFSEGDFRDFLFEVDSENENNKIRGIVVNRNLNLDKLVELVRMHTDMYLVKYSRYCCYDYYKAASLGYLMELICASKLDEKLGTELLDNTLTENLKTICSFRNISRSEKVFMEQTKRDIFADDIFPTKQDELYQKGVGVVEGTAAFDQYSRFPDQVLSAIGFVKRGDQTNNLFVNNLANIEAFEEKEAIMPLEKQLLFSRIAKRVSKK